MATVIVENVEKEVVVTKKVKMYNLRLDEIEAAVLYGLLGQIAGSKSYSARKYTTPIYLALQEAKVPNIDERVFVPTGGIDPFTEFKNTAELKKYVRPMGVTE